MHIPSLIVDLTIMLLAAGVFGLLFKRLKLPVILGYIVAGFLASPYFPLFFNVDDTEAISTWSEIGVVIILFHIGLEFDLHKLASVGSTAIVTAIVKIGGVMTVGYLFGNLIGLDQMNAVFLGAMLSISSTVVIQKCFQELKVGKEKYTSLVMGELIMEDLLSVFMMVILSTLSVSRNVNGTELISQLALMGCYLIVWLILGIYILPTLLNQIARHINKEMLIALSLGICFGMALIAKYLGFSMELGAFLAGSLFAGTRHAGKVERDTSSIKDMFAVVFFMSTGMMVDPSVIASRWGSILLLVVIAILAKLVFATIGMILSGEKLDTALKSGFSLAPIGEFSFIIASLGISLGVMDAYLYPVIVSASVCTILLTPFLIRSSGRIAAYLNRILPAGLLTKLQQYSSTDQSNTGRSSDWLIIIRQFFRSIVIYGVLMLVAAMACIRFLEPRLEQVLPGIWSEVASCAVLYFIVVLFFRPMMKPHDTTFTRLWVERRANRPPLVVLILAKLAVIALIVFMPLHYMFGAHQYLLLAAGLLAILIVARTNIVSSLYLEMETRFLRNLNENTLNSVIEMQGNQEWLDEDIHILSYFVPEGASYAGQTLAQMQWGRFYGVLMVKIRRGDKSILLPSGSTQIHEGDKIYLVGSEHALENMRLVLGIDPNKKRRTLRMFMESDYADTENALASLAIRVDGSEPYAGKSIIDTHILSKGHCLILGIQKDGYPVIMPDPHMRIGKDDVIWVMGSNNNVGRLAAMSSGLES